MSGDISVFRNNGVGIGRKATVIQWAEARRAVKIFCNPQDPEWPSSSVSGTDF